jgi:hypothetical protein
VQGGAPPAKAKAPPKATPAPSQAPAAKAAISMNENVSKYSVVNLF